MDRDLIENTIIELWDEYVESEDRIFQPTMTDFIQYLKDHRPNKESSETRTEPFLVGDVRVKKDPVTPHMELPGQVAIEFEASDAKYTGGDIRVYARKLRAEGWSWARIRAELKKQFGVNMSLTSVRRLVGLDR